MVTFLHLLIAGVWASTLVIHTRRLLRLACVAQLQRWERERLRSGLSRIWWWLGQDTFWSAVWPDCARAIEVSLMVFLIVLGHVLS